MRIKRLILINFGPFIQYDISFIPEDNVCMLLTGKNNEGKSNIIFALKLVDAATRVLNKSKQKFIDKKGDIYYKLLQQDIVQIKIGRLIHNYSDSNAEIHAEFNDELEIKVILDPNRDTIYADYSGYIPKDINNIFGFVPPLGPLSEEEEILGLKHLKSSLNTSLSPRHLRNHLRQLLTKEELNLVRDIVNKSWDDVELLTYEHDNELNIHFFYREGRFEREISWAGQGLQIWFQIVTHLVRLRNCSILVLDEPEINLHPEKQNELIRILKDYFKGSTIIATHSVELMNNVNVSHIIYVQKIKSKPKIKSTKDRTYLEIVRSQIGSNFNLIASQFDSFDLILFTEDSSDFIIINKLAQLFGINKNVFNIPIYGFCEYKKAIYYKQAYEILIGNNAKYSILLDRDHYPEEYLKSVKDQLEGSGIRSLFTLGKEIENLFLSPKIINTFIPRIPREVKVEFDKFWANLLEKERLDCFGSFLSLHEKFLPQKLDTKTITKKYTPIFDSYWNNDNKRHDIINGKQAIKKIKNFYQTMHKSNLSEDLLIEAVYNTHDEKLLNMINNLYFQ